MPDKILIFANPIAGRGKGRLLARKLQRELSLSGFSVETILNRPAETAASVLDRPLDGVVAIGGDGTLRSVVELFYARQLDGPVILPVPMGTANLMSQHLGIEWSEAQTVEAVVATIRRRKIVRLDAALANDRLFLLMAGVGIDAQIVHLLDHMRRGPIDKISYLLPAAIAFASYTFPPITVSVDDQTVLRNTPAIAMLSNVKEYGIGFPILPQAVPDDGLLDICVMPCHDRRQLIEILVQITAGEHMTRDDVVYLRGKTVRVDSGERVAVQVDGDSAGFTPLRVEVLPGRVPFLIPA